MILAEVSSAETWKLVIQATGSLIVALIALVVAHWFVLWRERKQEVIKAFAQIYEALVSSRSAWISLTCAEISYHEAKKIAYYSGPSGPYNEAKVEEGVTREQQAILDARTILSEYAKQLRICCHPIKLILDDRGQELITSLNALVQLLMERGSLSNEAEDAAGLHTASMSHGEINRLEGTVDVRIEEIEAQMNKLWKSVSGSWSIFKG